MTFYDADGKDYFSNHGANSMTTFRLGRNARIHDPRVPRMKDLPMRPMIKLPTCVDYAAHMPRDLGEMLNQKLSDCTCAAAGHAIQVWSFNAKPPMATPPDADILTLYENACGYIPGQPNTDQGGIEQVVLGYWLNNPVAGNELAAFVEIDQRDANNMMRAIFECGVVYIGFIVPAYIMEKFTAPGAIWDVDPKLDNTIVGGHAVDIVGYTDCGNLIFISWGSKYEMTPRFFMKYCDEAYALANAEWIKKTGTSPAGLSLEALEELMKSMRVGPAAAPQRRHRHHRRRKKAGLI